MALSAEISTALAGEYPLTAQFRSGPRNEKPAYEDWEEQQPQFYGHPVDVQSNVLRFAPSNYEFANKYAKDNPRTLVMSTWRAASGTPMGAKDDGDPLGVSNISFPGHFIYSPGGYLASSITSVSKTIKLKSGAENMIRGPALLVRTANSGRKVLWDEFEYVLITNANGNSVTVNREFNGSPEARSFPGGSTYLAPMPWDARNRKKYVDWFFNFSEFCPTDKQGRTAMDVVFGDMLYPMARGGELSHIGGLDLASGPLTVTPDNADYDLSCMTPRNDDDCNEDDGEIYKRGVRNFYKEVRSVLGPNRILTTSLDYRNVDMINGVNLEGLARPDDAWVEVARTVNKVLSWKRIAELPMVSIAFVQYVKSADQDKIVNLHRLLNGYATCLGLAADVDDDDLPDGLNELIRIELYKGDDREPHWLGKAVGEVKRPATLTPNLLGNAKSNTDWDNMMKSMSVGRRADMSVKNGELIIAPNGYGSGYVTLEMYFRNPRKSDITVYMEIKSDDDQIERDILLPRLSGVSYETGPTRASFSGMEYFPLSFYVRRAAAGSVKMDFRFADGGNIKIRTMSVHAAPDTLACEYERGVVLVNPSLDDAELDLREIFPRRDGFKRLKASAPDEDIPDRYKPQLRQALEMNNGGKIGSPRSVEVGERNSLFLLTTDTVEGSGTGGGGSTGGGGTGGDSGGGDTSGGEPDDAGSNDPPPPPKDDKDDGSGNPLPNGQCTSDSHCDKGECCSQYGYCGTGSAYCGSDEPSGGGTTGGGGTGGGGTNIFDGDESEVEFPYKDLMLSCKWAGKKIHRRCAKVTDLGPLVKEYCPKTCRG